MALKIGTDILGQTYARRTDQIPNKAITLAQGHFDTVWILNSSCSKLRMISIMN